MYLRSTMSGERKLNDRYPSIDRPRCASKSSPKLADSAHVARFLAESEAHVARALG